MNWLDEFLAQTAELESPRRFFFWAGLAALSAVVRRNVYLNRGGAYKLYPNIYVMLVAKSGMRKGIPVAYAQKLVTEANATRVIGGRSSIQAIIDHLGTATPDPKTGEIVKEASCFIAAGEFSQSLLEDPQGLTILTNLYDGHYQGDGFVNLLKSGKSILKDVSITLLGASNEAHLDHVITGREIMGGFIARTFMVYENRRTVKNPLVDPPAFPVNLDVLAEHLRHIKNVKGEFQYSEAGKNHYVDWYMSYEPDGSDQTGTSERVHDHILKVAMLFSLAESDSLILEEHHISQAIEVCLDCVASSKRASLNNSSNDIGKQTILVLKELLDSENLMMSRLTLLQRNWGKLDASSLNLVVDTLEQAGALTSVKVGNKLNYVLNPAVAEKFRQLVAKEREKH